MTPAAANNETLAGKAVVTKDEEADEFEALNHTLKVVFLGGGGSDAPSTSLRMYSQSQHHSKQTTNSVKPMKPGVSLSVK